MAEGPDGKNIIIVKKVSGHGGHHGGAWKVAFADFITAMMALFMVLWLVNTASVITRERIANFFRQPGVFEMGSGTPLQIGGAGILSDAFSPPTEGNSDVATGFTNKVYVIEKHGGLGKGIADTMGAGNSKAGSIADQGEQKSKIDQGGYDSEKSYQEKIELEKIASTIKAEIGQKIDSNQAKISPEQLARLEEINKYLGNIEIKVDQRGLHLEIMDTATASMFEVGSSKIKSSAEKEILKIAKALSNLPNPVDIEGHTDSTPFNSKMKEHYDNWNLSSDRANEARRLLVKAGIAEKQVARVIGYADRRPKTGNPLDPSNRRISISMRYTEHAAKALEGTQTQVTEPKILPEVAAALKNSKESAKISGDKKQAGSSSGLEVNLQTTLPEGELQVNKKKENNDPSWRQKDKIFGNINPFFSK